LEAVEEWKDCSFSAAQQELAHLPKYRGAIAVQRDFIEESDTARDKTRHSLTVRAS